MQNKTNVGFLTDKNLIRAVPTVSKKCINPLFRYFHMNNILIKRENNKVMKMNNVKTMEIRDIEINEMEALAFRITKEYWNR